MYNGPSLTANPYSNFNTAHVATLTTYAPTMTAWVGDLLYVEAPAVQPSELDRLEAHLRKRLSKLGDGFDQLMVLFVKEANAARARSKAANEAACRARPKAHRAPHTYALPAPHEPVLWRARPPTGATRGTRRGRIARSFRRACGRRRLRR